MTNIERYLRGALPLDELTNAERCAICAAREGRFVTDIEQFKKDFPNTHVSSSYPRGGYQIIARYKPGPYGAWADSVYTFAPDQYLYDGTAALRLVERFRIELMPPTRNGKGWAAYPHVPVKVYVRGPTSMAAIVACVCEIVKAEWPYKEAK